MPRARLAALLLATATLGGCATLDDCPYSDCYPRYGYWGMRPWGYYGPYWDPYPYYGPRYGGSLFIYGGGRTSGPVVPPPSSGLVTPPDTRRSAPRPVAPPVVLPPAGLPGGSPSSVAPPAVITPRGVAPPSGPSGPRRAPMRK